MYMGGNVTCCSASLTRQRLPNDMSQLFSMRCHEFDQNCKQVPSAHLESEILTHSHVLVLDGCSVHPGALRLSGRRVCTRRPHARQELLQLLSELITKVASNGGANKALLGWPRLAGKACDNAGALAGVPLFVTWTAGV